MHNAYAGVSQEVVIKLKPFAPGYKVCKLCYKKLSIIRSAPSLNKKNEVFGHCMHKKRFQINHNSNIILSTDEVAIVDPEL